MAAMIDSFPGSKGAINSPYTRWVIITPHDTNLLAKSTGTTSSAVIIALY